jgi:hypothetical protein
MTCDRGMHVEQRAVGIEDIDAGQRILQPGPFYRRARELYWEFAHATAP